MPITKAVRLSDDEIASIEEFLRKNPLFDFSSLARTAIRAFIQSPSLSVLPVQARTKRRSKTVFSSKGRN